MSFELRFKTVAEGMDLDALTAWLLERGEPAVPIEQSLGLKALPVVFEHRGSALCAVLDITGACPLTRLVDMLFDLSMEVGADIELSGRGDVSRSRLWLVLADEQDRVRLADALERSREHSNCMEVLRRLLSVVNSLRPGRDDRWDAARSCIVEFVEVGAEGLSLSEARRHQADAEVGDEVGVPVEGHLHTLAWRWFSASYPGLAESQHSMH